MSGGGPVTLSGKLVVCWNATRHGIDFLPAPVVPSQKSGQAWESPCDKDTPLDSGRVCNTHYALDRFPTPKRENDAHLVAKRGKRKSVTQRGDED
jgi:hypothetical protein